MKPCFSPSCDHSCVKMAASRKYLSKNKLADGMIKQLQIDYLPQPLASANNIDLLTTDKTQYFAQPRPMRSQGSK